MLLAFSSDFSVLKWLSNVLFSLLSHTPAWYWLSGACCVSGFNLVLNALTQFRPLLLIGLSGALEVPSSTSLLHIRVWFSNNALVVSGNLGGLAFVCKAPLGKGTGSLQFLPSNTGLPTIKICYFFHLWTLMEVRRMTLAAAHCTNWMSVSHPAAAGCTPTPSPASAVRQATGPWHVLYCHLNHRTIESLRLEKTSKIIRSNRHPNTTMPAKLCPEVPHLHVFWTPPGMGTPPLPWAACACRDAQSLPRF